MSNSPLARVAALVDEWLLLWVVLAVLVGVAVPSIGALSRLSTPILAVMIGSVSLTLSPERFREVRGRAVLAILLAQTAMPLLGFAIASALSLSPALTAGFVVVGAVTPELVTPTMTELGGGDTALATTALLLVGLGTLAVVPGATTALLGASVTVDAVAIVEQLLLAVVLPMTLAVSLRSRWPERIGAYDDLYPSVSGVMVVLLVGIVTASNASLVRGGGVTLLVVAGGAVALNCTGYALGWTVGARLTRPERIATALSVGMRDFAVAAAILVGAGFPPAATLPAVAFGIVEMATSAGLAKWFGRAR
ncbi:bile acid:sodium symporter [Halomicroarcula limicola]|uniref:Bile acid:sodium symporter n=1 Tax=Haloarcula limicola TaxID=1429915 RepID=A0A8J7Y7Q9_9EURY|nr:bile acid:sodium symporter [Halomicroarcula limicola]MBV0925627.1 bile acid:sodium symporter [Halomicroarcula limicola]